MKFFTPRHFAVALATVMSVTAILPARAEYPERPITAIVPFTAGGLSDVTGRLLAAALSKRLGQNIVVENRAGAGGNIGIRAAIMDAKPDGYTILLCSIAMTVNPALYNNLLWDPAKVQPVALVALAPMAISVNAAKFPRGNLMDVIAELKKAPGKYNIPSPDSTINENLFHQAAGVSLAIIPYGGSGDAATSTLKGETDLMTISLQVTAPLAQGGGIRVLAVTGDSRMDIMPDVPTTREAGVPGYNVQSYNGVYVPVGTPMDIVNRLNKGLNEVVSDPDIAKRFKDVASIVRQSTVQQAADFYKKDLQDMKDLVTTYKVPKVD